MLAKVFPINLKPGKQAVVDAIVEEFAPMGPAQEKMGNEILREMMAAIANKIVDGQSSILLFWLLMILYAGASFWT